MFGLWALMMGRWRRRTEIVERQGVHLHISQQRPCVIRESTPRVCAPPPSLLKPSAPRFCISHPRRRRRFFAARLPQAAMAEQVKVPSSTSLHVVLYLSCCVNLDMHTRHGNLDLFAQKGCMFVANRVIATCILVCAGW